MDSLPTSPEVTYNWVDITTDFFKHIQGMAFYRNRNINES